MFESDRSWKPARNVLRFHSSYGSAASRQVQFLEDKDMAKERTWVDYANLASNVAQNLQLRHANQTLEELQRAATASALTQQQKRLADEQEAQLREYVFQLSEDIEGLQRHLNELPCAAFALGLQIKGLLEKNNVTTASFREWEDKDRLKQVLKGLNDVCEKSSALLTEWQREDAIKCAKFLAERDALDQLISIQREQGKFQNKKEQLEKSRAEKLDEVTKLKSENRLPAWCSACFALGGLGLTFCVLWLFLFSLSTGLWDSDDDAAPQGQLTTPLSVPGSVTFGIFLISFVVCIVPITTPAWNRFAGRNKKINALKAGIASIRTELSTFDSKSPIRGTSQMSQLLGRDLDRELEELFMSKGDLSHEWVTRTRLEQLYALFGNNLPSEAYEQMKRERETLIKNVFGKSDAAATAS